MDEAWIDTVRLARDFGTVSELLPPGVDELRDLPYPLFDAIRQATFFISFEELQDDERPPRRIWDDGEALQNWFAEVKRRRERRASGRGDVDDPVENDAARALVVG